MRLNICLLLDKKYPLERPWTPKIVEVFFRFIPNKGHNLTIIMYTRKYRETISYTRNRLFYLLHSRNFLNLINILKKMRFIIKRNQECRFDIYHVRNGIIDGLIGIYLRRKYSLPFIYELTFPMALKLQQFRHHRRTLKNIYYYLLGKIWEYVSLKIMSEANLVIPQSRWMKEYLKGKGIFEKKMLPHSMGVNINFFSPKISGAKIRRSLKLENSCVLVYVGNMNRMRKLSILIECLLIVKGEVENVKLLMVGDGDDRTNLENLVHKYNLQNEIIFTGQIPYSEVPTYIAAADICLSPLPLDPVFQISSPTKLFEYMAMGKPVVASEIPEQKEVLIKSQAGICVPFQVKEFSKAICYLLKNGEVAREMGLRGRTYVSKYSSFSYLGDKLLSWYEHLINVQQNHIYME